MAAGHRSYDALLGARSGLDRYGERTERVGTLGRSTFTPDDVAAMAAPGGDLQLVTFYHDGKQVKDHPLEQMVQLMGVQAEK